VAAKPLRLGTRGSALALAQANLVATALGGAEVVPIRTSGDEPAAQPAPGGDKARFVREIERALLDGDVDIGVHSAKDLPSELPDGLRIAGVPRREDPRDCWIGPDSSLEAVPEGTRAGTSSLRRRAQLLALRPDLEAADLSGNVDTRLGKLAAGDYDGIVLAAAGLVRLGRTDEIAFRLEPEEMTPAPGQGALALETRSEDTDAVRAAEAIGDPEGTTELRAERAAVAELEASCSTPLGVQARHRGEGLMISAFCGLPDGSEWIRDELEGDRDDPEGLARLLVERLRTAGAAELLARAEKMAEPSGAGQ
jgi:hydroxymethylbilane synthase